MENPTHLRRQVVLYSLPLLLVTSHFPGPALFILSIPSSAIVFLVVGTRKRMYASNVLFLLFLLFPETYFICYGFTVSTTYISVNSLCLDTFQQNNLRICTAVESIGLFLSLHFLNNRIVSLVLTLLQFINIRYLISPPIESADYGRAYEKVVKLLDGASFSNKAGEYRRVVRNRSQRMLRAKADFLTPLIMGNLSFISKVTICCSSLILNRKSYWMCFIAYSLLFFSPQWCCAVASFFCNFTPGHPTYRLISAQILYLMIR